MTANHTNKSPSAAAEPILFCPPHLIAGEHVILAQDNSLHDNDSRGWQAYGHDVTRHIVIGNHLSITTENITLPGQTRRNILPECSRATPAA
jgi:hypothetical protein